jgi:hypothetical protein
MKLINFRLDDPTQGIILTAFGLEWDLHNFASFRGLTFECASGVLRLAWVAPSVENPWGCPSNKAIGCNLVFRRIEQLIILPTDGSPQFQEPNTLHGLSKVVPEPGEFRFRKDWQDFQPFNLLFEFGNGWSIEIDAESAELQPIA